MQSLKNIQIQAEYRGTLEILGQAFLQLSEISKLVLVEVPLLEISNWQKILDSLTAQTSLQLFILLKIEENGDLSPETICDRVRGNLDGSDATFGNLLLKLLDSPAQISFAQIPSQEPAASPSLTCLITDAVGETVWLRFFTYSESQPLMNAEWSWGDPDGSAKRENLNFEKAWSQSTENGLASTSLRQSLRDILGSRIVPPKPGIEVLFPHQSNGVDAWIQNQYRGIFEMCTGAGKTIASLAALRALVKELREKGKELSAAVVLCPTQVLVEQWESEIARAGFDPPLLAYENISNYVSRLGITLNGSRHTGLRIVVTTDATFTSQPFLNEIGKATEAGTRALLIADEMHNYGSGMTRKALEAARDYFSFRLGLSATPEVEGDEFATKFLFNYFGSVVGKYTLRQAIEDKVLCSYKYFPSPIFLDSKTSSQYLKTLREIGLAVRPSADLFRQRNDLLRRSGVQIDALKTIVDEIQRTQRISQTLVFCPPGKDSSEEQERLLHRVKRVFEERQILTTSIVAGTPAKDRPGILEAFAKGEFQVLLAIGCLDEGMNVPSTQRAIMLYSLDRSRQFIQRRGRILRRSANKDFAIINDIIILPHNSDMPEGEARVLLRKELRRYEEFASMAMNKDDAQAVLDQAFEVAARIEGIPCLRV